MVWNQKFQTPASTVNGASTMLFQWQQAQAKVQKQSYTNSREGVAVWQKASPGLLDGLLVMWMLQLISMEVVALLGVLLGMNQVTSKQRTEVLS